MVEKHISKKTQTILRKVWYEITKLELMDGRKIMANVQNLFD